MSQWSKKGISQKSHKERKEMVGNRFGGGRVGYLLDTLDSFVPADGENKIRIVEPIEVDDIKWYAIDVSFHRNVGFRKDFYLCLTEMGVGPCYICEQRTNELWDEDPEAAKALFPNRRVLMLVLDLKSSEPNKLLKWSCPISLSDEIINQSKEPESDVYQNPSDPHEGPAVFFTRTGKGLQTKYSGVSLGKEPYPLTDEVANQRVEFADLLVVPDYEAVKAAYLNAQPPDEEAPPVEAYAEDKEAQQQQPNRTKYEEPEAEAEPEADEMLLVGLSRDDLKKFKVAHKGMIEGLGFTIYKTMSDDELATNIAKEIEAAGFELYSDNGVISVREAAAEAEVEEEEEPEIEAEEEEPAAAQPPSVAGAERKKQDVKASLRAAIRDRKQ